MSIALRRGIHADPPPIWDFRTAGPAPGPRLRGTGRALAGHCDAGRSRAGRGPQKRSTGLPVEGTCSGPHQVAAVKRPERQPRNNLQMLEEWMRS